MDEERKKRRDEALRKIGEIVLARVIAEYLAEQPIQEPVTPKSAAVDDTPHSTVPPSKSR